MHLIETVLLLLLAVVVSGSIARITRIALPLVQIGLGAAIVLIHRNDAASRARLLCHGVIPQI